MKTKRKSEADDELRPEYDIRRLMKGSVQGKYAERYRAGTNLVLLAPDVADAFANDGEKISEALRLVLRLSRIPASKRRRLSKSGAPVG